MRSSASTAFAFLILSLVIPRPLSAQVEVHARLAGQVGFIAPRGPLYDRETGGFEDWDLSRSVTDLGSYPLLGLSIDIGDPQLGIWIKGRVNRSIGLQADFTGWGIYVCPPGAICLAWVPPPQRFDWRLDASITEVGLDVVLPTRLSLNLLEPYVVAGMGVRHFQFDRPDQSEWRKFHPPGDGAEWSFRVGGGMDLRLMSRNFSLSVIDSMSEYWGDLRHHVIVEVGVPLVSKILFTSAGIP